MVFFLLLVSYLVWHYHDQLSEINPLTVAAVSLGVVVWQVIGRVLIRNVRHLRQLDDDNLILAVLKPSNSLHLTYRIFHYLFSTAGYIIGKGFRLLTNLVVRLFRKCWRYVREFFEEIFNGVIELLTEVVQFTRLSYSPMIGYVSGYLDLPVMLSFKKLLTSFWYYGSTILPSLFGIGSITACVGSIFFQFGFSSKTVWTFRVVAALLGFLFYFLPLLTTETTTDGGNDSGSDDESSDEVTDPTDSTDKDETVFGTHDDPNIFDRKRSSHNYRLRSRA